MNTAVTMKWALCCVLISIVATDISNGSPFTKYGRSCRDIICTVREECVMQRDECTSHSDKCGNFPTCKRKAGNAVGCAALKCTSGHFCSIRQEACDRPPCQIKPTCIAFRTPAPSTTRSGSKLYSSSSYAKPSSNQYSYSSQQNRRSWSNDRTSG